MYLTSFIKSIFFFIVALLFLVGSPLSAAKPVKTDVVKEKKAPPGKVKSPIIEEPSDTTAPVITLNGSNQMDVIQGDTFTDPGATATDDTDGSITVSATGSVDTSTVGTYTITYTARDSAGNTATKTRTVNVVAAPDIAAPVITLNGSNQMDVIQGDTFTDPGATATDNTDGSITVSATGSVDTSTVGTYTITYTATDSAGNSATEIRTVNIAAAPIIEETPICIVGDAALEGILKDSATGVVLANVEVSVGGCTTTTNEQGFYTLSNLTANEETTVNFDKEGYFLGSTQIQLKSLSGDNTTSPNYLEYSMSVYSDAWDNGRVWTYESQNGATGGAVEVPAGAIHTDASGTVYNGTVSARWVFKDTMTAEGRDAFPGSFKGINTNGVLVPFVSYGLTSLELENESGVSLSVSEHITLVLPSVTGTTEDILPLWYYDYNQGLWVEEGYAERQADGTYRADISHPGTWSLSQAIKEEVGIYRGHIVDEDGSPMSDVRLHAVGENWISSDLSTDEDGMFEIKVIPGNSFQLKAYNYKDKYGAVYNGTIQAIASGEIMED